MYHPFRSFLALAAVVLCAGSASAALLYYDSYNYSNGSLSTVAPANWTKSGGATSDPTATNAGGLKYTGLTTSNDTSNAAYDGSAPAGVASHQIDPVGISTGTLYASLLMKVPTVNTGTGAAGAQGFSTGANLTFGSFFAGFDTVAPGTVPATNNVAASLLIVSGDGTQFSSTYKLGTSITTNNADRTFYNAQTYTTGSSAQTVFVVLKYTFDPSNNSNETSKLFINPTPGQPEPSPQVIATYDALLTRNNGIRSFFMRHNTVEPDVMYVDELRIGTTWQDVTAPEPASITLLGLTVVGILGRRRSR